MAIDECYGAIVIEACHVGVLGHSDYGGLLEKSWYYRLVVLVMVVLVGQTLESATLTAKDRVAERQQMLRYYVQVHTTPTPICVSFSAKANTMAHTIGDYGSTLPTLYITQPLCLTLQTQALKTVN